MGREMCCCFGYEQYKPVDITKQNNIKIVFKYGYMRRSKSSDINDRDKNKLIF